MLMSFLVFLLFSFLSTFSVLFLLFLLKKSTLHATKTRVAEDVSVNEPTVCGFILTEVNTLSTNTTTY